MDNNEFHKSLLNTAINGGDSDGRLLLHHIVSLLIHGNEQELTHGLLPKEYVSYLIDTLSQVIVSPKKADKILKISKPKHRETEINILHDGAISYMCMKAMDAQPEKSDDAIFGDIAYEISEDHKDLLMFRSNKNSISLKTIERTYKEIQPIISQFKYIKGYEWILRKGALIETPTDESITDAINFSKLNDEIESVQINIDTLRSLPESDDLLYKQLATACLKDIFNDNST